MLCPYCQTENRDDEEKCYHCDRDLAMLRLIVNKAKHHYNQGLESAERGRVDEAITEMRNALDLDASLVNARVVLGTLYAKQEKFEEARREWEQALAFDHRYHKAHEYLAKAETVERELPGIKRLRRLSQGLVIALGAVVLLAAIMFVYAVINRPGRRGGPGSGRGGVVATANKGAGATTETMQGGYRRADIDDRMDALLAEVQGLRSELSQAPRAEAGGNELEFANAALAAGSPQLALEFARKAEGARAREVENDAAAALVASLREDSARYFSGRLDAETFLTGADRAIRALGDHPAAGEVNALRDRVHAAEGNKLLAAANAAIAGGTLEDAIKTAGELKTRRPDLAEAVGLTLALRLDVEGKKIAEEVDSRANEGDFAGALARVDELAMAYQAAGRGENAAIEDLRKSVLAKQNAHTVEEAQSAFAAKEWEHFLESAARVDPGSISAEQKGSLDRQQAQARNRLAAANWAWFEKLDPKVSGGRLSEEEARRATGIYRETLDHLPANLGWTRAPILYYTAAAYLRLGENAKAAQLLAEIDAMEKVPDYIKGPVKELKGRVEAATAP